MIKQITPYGCGMYAVANCVAGESYVTEKRLEESKNGNTINQLNRWLIEDGKEWNIECMYYTSFTNKESKHGIIIPSDAHFYSSDDKLIPIIINVQKNEASKLHLIGALLRNDGIIILDSCMPEPFKTNWIDINNHYMSVYGVWIFQPFRGTGYVCIESGQIADVKQSTFTEAPLV